MLDSVYELGGYDMVIDYGKPPPKLSDEEIGWVDELLMEQRAGQL